MCGQVGLIVSRRRRSEAEVAVLSRIFTELLVRSEARGHHASGVAVIDRDGRHRLFKRPVPASRLVVMPEFANALGAVEGRNGREAGRTTLLLGHTRYRTRGCESNNANNHPLRAADWIGTANGTIHNAAWLFRRYGLRRHAEVDSELILRLADKFSASDDGGSLGRRGLAFRCDGHLDAARFIDALRLVRGQLSAVFVSLCAPETTWVIHGNRPLVLRAHRRNRVVAYASEARFLDAVLDDQPGWREFPLPPMTLARFDHDDIFYPEYNDIDFVREERLAPRDRPIPAMR